MKREKLKKWRTNKNNPKISINGRELSVPATGYRKLFLIFFTFMHLYVMLSRA